MPILGPSSNPSPNASPPSNPEHSVPRSPEMRPGPQTPAASSSGGDDAFEGIVARAGEGHWGVAKPLRFIPEDPIDQDGPPDDPVLASDGHVYGLAGLHAWFAQNHGRDTLSPLTREPLTRDVRRLHLGSPGGAACVWVGRTETLVPSSTPPWTEGPWRIHPALAAPETPLGRLHRLTLSELEHSFAMATRIDLCLSREIFLCEEGQPSRNRGLIGAEDAWRLINSVHNQQEADVPRDKTSVVPMTFTPEASLIIQNQLRRSIAGQSLRTRLDDDVCRLFWV